MMEQIAFASFSKLHFTVGEPEDVAFCGQLQYYDKLFDRVTPKATRPLHRTQRVFRSVTTSDDPVIRWVLCSLLSTTHHTPPPSSLSLSLSPPLFAIGSS